MSNTKTVEAGERTQVNREQLNARLDGLRDAMVSLRGCTRGERPNESRILFRVMQDVIALELNCINPSTEERKIRLLTQAGELLTEYKTAT